MIGCVAVIVVMVPSISASTAGFALALATSIPNRVRSSSSPVVTPPLTASHEGSLIRWYDVDTFNYDIQEFSPVS